MSRVVPAFVEAAELRPMTLDDVPAVDMLFDAAFDDLARRRGRDEPVRDATSHARNRSRLEHLIGTDPGGAWVADAGRQVVGCSIAIVREGVWGLSLLLVDPEHQGSGTGRALLDRAVAYPPEGFRGGMILASDDPRASRGYRRIGFDLRPAMAAAGAVRRSAIPSVPAVRDGDTGDLELCAAIDREQRGAAHGADIEAMLAADARLLVVPDRGYAVERDGSILLLAARDEEAAVQLLWATLADSATGVEVGVYYLTGEQGWAIDVALAAGLDVSPGGPVFTRGELGPLAPYVPNGAYL